MGLCRDTVRCGFGGDGLKGPVLSVGDEDQYFRASVP